MNFQPISNTLLQSDDGQYQISRGPGPTADKFTYRAWHRPTNTVLAKVDCWDEAGDRAAAVGECKQACANHAETCA